MQQENWEQGFFMTFSSVIFFQKKRVSMYRILETLFFPDKMDQAPEASEKIRSILHILTGLCLVALVRSGRWKYHGPKVLHEYKRKLFFMYQKEFPDLKLCKIHLHRVPVPEGSLPKRRKLFKLEAISCGQDKQKYIEDKLKDVDVSTLNPEQRHSYEMRKIVCRCGKTVEGTTKKVHAGFKRRVKCQKCSGCKAPKCMRCTNCLNPRNKQACQDKICLFPKVPKCPCFVKKPQTSESQPPQQQEQSQPPPPPESQPSPPPQQERELLLLQSEPQKQQQTSNPTTTITQAREESG